MNENNNSEPEGKIITPNAEEIERMKKMAHSATLSLAIVLGQMWAEHKRIDADEKPVEFAISLRSGEPRPDPMAGLESSGPGASQPPKPERIAMFRAEAMWLQKVNGEEKVFHAHGPAFGAEQLNQGVNITMMFRALGEGVQARQKQIEEEAGLTP